MPHPLRKGSNCKIMILNIFNMGMYYFLLFIPEKSPGPTCSKMRIDDSVCESQSQVRQLERFPAPWSCGRDPTFLLGMSPSLAISHTWVLFILSYSYQIWDQK